jgi:hypothetical protein
VNPHYKNYIESYLLVSTLLERSDFVSSSLACPSARHIQCRCRNASAIILRCSRRSERRRFTTPIRTCHRTRRLYFTTTLHYRSDDVPREKPSLSVPRYNEADMASLWTYHAVMLASWLSPRSKQQPSDISLRRRNAEASMDDCD